MQNNRSPYMLLFRNSGPETHQHLSADQRQQLMMRWNAWYDGLAAQGKAVEGQPLELETRFVTAERVTDGPFTEAKEAIGGYVKLMVSSFEEATEIAQQHPGLVYGLVIEVRSMTADCHLGVRHHSAELAAVSRRCSRPRESPLCRRRRRRTRSWSSISSGMKRRGCMAR